jgi:hypothetical protein
VLALCLMGGVAGCGDDGGASLAWTTEPELLTPPDLPHDRVLRGVVKNRTGHRVALRASEVRVLRPDGRPVKASVTFIAGYAHRLFPPTRGPKNYPESENERLGTVSVIDPGAATSLTVSWREDRPANRPTQVDLGPETLEIPYTPPGPSPPGL